MDERPAGDQHDEEPGPGDDASAGDLLCDVAAHVAALDASPGARALLAEILAATLQAFTRTTSVRDPLPATAPHSAEESLAILGGLDHLRSSLAAIEAIWQVRAEQRIREADRREGASASDQGKGTASEVGIAGRVSPASASFSLASARRLVQHLPGTFGRLWDGRLPVRQAVTVASTLATADPETCDAIDKLISEDPLSLAGKGDRQLRSDLQRMIQQLEPERSRDRAERAARARHVTMTPLADGMARVNAVLRAVDAAGLMKSLQRGAESLRAAGAKHSVPALEADLLVGAVIERADPPSPDAERVRRSPGLELGIVITDTALLGRDNETECAQLEGYGTIPAHIITDTLLGTPPGYLRSSGGDHPDEEVSAFYRRLYTSPSTGELVGMESRARAFPAGLARMIRWRDVTCRTPWCTAIVRQIDHAEPHHRGGPTSYANGQGLCTRCNLAKELGLWTLTPCGPSPAPEPPTSRWSWSSPHGAYGLSPVPRLVDRREPAHGAPPADPPGTIPSAEDPDPPDPATGPGPPEPPESPPAPVAAFHRRESHVSATIDPDPGRRGGWARNRDRSRRGRPSRRADRRAIRDPLRRDVLGDVRLRAERDGRARGAGRRPERLDRTAPRSHPWPEGPDDRHPPCRGRSPPRTIRPRPDPSGSHVGFRDRRVQAAESLGR